MKADNSIDQKLNQRNAAFSNAQKDSAGFLYSGAVPPAPTRYEYSRDYFTPAKSLALPSYHPSPIVASSLPKSQPDASNLQSNPVKGQLTYKSAYAQKFLAEQKQFASFQGTDPLRQASPPKTTTYLTSPQQPRKSGTGISTPNMIEDTSDYVKPYGSGKTSSRRIRS